MADHPLTGSRSAVGLNPNTPLLAAGDLIDPPISVPIPRIEPRRPTRAPSPPEDPPAVRVVLCGFTVVLCKRVETGWKISRDDFIPCFHAFSYFFIYLALAMTNSGALCDIREE